MRHLLVLGVGRRRQSLVLADPPTSKLHVVVLVGAVGRFARGQVRDHQQLVVQEVADALGLLARLPLFVAQIPALLGQLLGGLGVVFAPRFADEPGEELHFGPETLGLLKQCTVPHVHREDLVHHLGRDPATGQGGLYDIGFTAQSDEIDHAHQPTEHVRANSKDALGSVVVSNAVQVTNLSVRFGALQAVDDVSLHVDYGDVVTLLGPNGAGKTTLVETLLGFRAPESGTVRLHGLNPLRDHHEVVVRTGALLQRGGVWAPMTPRQVMDLTASYYQAPRDSAELLTLLDLNSCARTPWRRLSGGEQQRTLLALALLGRPRVLVLDEPTTAVDPEGRQVIRDLIRSERDRGCALLITTHELTEAERLADRLVIMNRGHVVIQGTLDGLAGAPEMILDLSAMIDTDALASVLGCVVVADGARRVRCETASSPERIAQLNDYLAGLHVTLVSLRTRASLEERYMDLLDAERTETSS